jgi:hypothetical protein
VQQMQAPAPAGAGESKPGGYRSRCLGSRAQSHAPATHSHVPTVPPVGPRSPGP